MIRKIVQYPNKILLSPSEEVTKFDSSISALIADMIETANSFENCVGLAAVQIGIPKRISIIKNGNKFITVINPEVIYESGEKTIEWEGCMSVGEADDQLFSKVSRDNKITVKYKDKLGVEKTKQYNGFLAHAFGHEIDHMNGILFLKHVKDPTDIWKDKDLNTYYKKYNTLP